ALRRVQVELDENRAGVRREQNITFDEWADRYEAIIEGRIADGDLHPRTLTSYRSTLDRARKVFGSLHLREIGAPELRDFSEAPGENLKPASRIRYLRELSACFSAALDEDKGWLETNPVRLFLK